ncbi:MAG: secondary thiamine-phosphate synthase enzyme YjbQ [Bacteroidota bacterium]
MIQQKEIILPAFPRGFHLITNHIRKHLPDFPKEGLLHIFIKHTSAGLTINENYDPDVRQDYETIFNKLIPENDPDYVHTIEGPDDMPAHVKSSLVGSSVSIPITEGKLNLGTWQGVFLCEFRNRGGARKLVLTAWS